MHENCAGGCAEICAAMLPTLTSCKMKRVARPHEGPTQKPLHQLRERLALPCPTTKAEPESTHMGAAAPNRQVIWGERVPGAPNRPCSVGLMTKSGAYVTIGDGASLRHPKEPEKPRAVRGFSTPARIVKQKAARTLRSKKDIPRTATPRLREVDKRKPRRVLGTGASFSRPGCVGERGVSAKPAVG